MPQAAWEALLRDAVQGLHPPYTPQALRQWLQATHPQAWATGAPSPPRPSCHHHTRKGQDKGKGRARGTKEHTGKRARKIPSEGRHTQGQGAGSDTTWGQETTQEPGRGGNGDQDTEEKGTTAGTTTHTQEGHTTTGRPAPPQPHQTPQHTPPQQTSDAIRITPAHAHQPPETTRRTEGTPTRGERATPTEEAAGNAAARCTTTPSPPGDDPDHHKGHLTGTARGRKHGRGTHDYGPKPPEDTGPRHRPPGRATPRTVTRPHHGL